MTLRSGYSNNYSYFQKECAAVCFTRAADHIFGELSTHPEAIFIPLLLWLFTSEHLYPQGESWSTPGENSLTLFTLLSAMQILLIWEEVADLSNMIIAASSIPRQPGWVFWAFSFHSWNSLGAHKYTLGNKSNCPRCTTEPLFDGGNVLVLYVPCNYKCAYIISMKCKLCLVSMFHLTYNSLVKEKKESTF